MFWFRKNSNVRQEQKQLEQLAANEVAKHTQKTHDTIAETTKVADNFNRIIKENGFTLKIHIAAGGKR